MPPTTGSSPATISGLGLNRVTRRGASRDMANSAAVIGTKAKPARNGSQPSTSCTNWVRKKNDPNIPATSSSRAAAVAEQAQWRDRLAAPGLDQQEHGQQERCGSE